MTMRFHSAHERGGNGMAQVGYYTNAHGQIGEKRELAIFVRIALVSWYIRPFFLQSEAGVNG